jgi:hypothetical protein
MCLYIRQAGESHYGHSYPRNSRRFKRIAKSGAVLPQLWVPAAVEDCNDFDSIRQHAVIHYVRESPQFASPDVPANYPIQFGQGLDPSKYLVNRIEKCLG